MKQSFSYKKLTIAALLIVLLLSLVSPASAEKKLYLPKGIKGVEDFNDPNSAYCFDRMVEGDNVVFFWHKEHGDDPLNHANPDMSFDVKYMLEEAERCYTTYVEDMKLVVKGNSVSDKYKLLGFVKEGGQGAATGGRNGDVAVFTSPAPRVHQSPYGVIAHEMIHCFQHMNRRDGGSGGGINGEMAAQHGLWQNLPGWLKFENSHFVAFMNQSNLKFDHPQNMYHTSYVMEYWAFLHGKDFYGTMLRSEHRGDSVTVYKAQFHRTQEQFNDEMFYAYRRFITWDLPRIEHVARPYANQHHTKLNAIDDGWFKISDSKCPQNYGYNGIKLKVPDAGTIVTVDFKGVADEAKQAKAGWRYGFVASLRDKSRVYSGVGKEAENIVSIRVPANTEYLWLVVMGAPTEHSGGGGFGGGRRRGGGGAAGGGDDQWPYQIKLTGTTIDESCIE